MENKIFYLLVLIFCFLFSCTEISYRDINKENYKIIAVKYNNNDSLVKKKYIGHYKIGKPYIIDGKTYYPQKNDRYSEIGFASWYGNDFHNKKTANGEIFDKNQLTAAHKTLPLPSVVKITNLENGRHIVVRVNDRGPFVDKRIIDVSEHVAKILDMHKQGVSKVKVEYLKKESDSLLQELFD